MQILAVNIVIALFAMFVTWLPWVMYFKEFISFNNLLAMPAGVMLWLCWSGVLHTDRRDPDIPGWLMSIALVFSLPFYRLAYVLWAPDDKWIVGAIVFPLLFIIPAAITLEMTRHALRKH